MNDRVGQVLAGKYRLEARLGSGGMGDVYRASNELVGRPVAIKVLRGEHTETPGFVERFMREARAANLVRHRHVVDVLDIGQDEAGAPFIVQELLEGEDLGHYLRRRGDRLGWATAVELLLPVVDAVAEAHARGIVHRDLKPENVFLARDGEEIVPKLLDFGLSKDVAREVRLTETGATLGTPAYMAPELIEGANDADPRSDVWALGVMFFELLAGRLPFVASGAPALFVAIATRDAPPLSEVLPDVANDVALLVARCLRRRPDERYPTAAELARDIRRIEAGATLEATAVRAMPPSLVPEVPDLAAPSRRPERTLAIDVLAQDASRPPPRLELEPVDELASVRRARPPTTWSDPEPSAAPLAAARVPTSRYYDSMVPGPRPDADAPAEQAPELTLGSEGSRALGPPLPGVMLGPTAGEVRKRAPHAGAAHATRRLEPIPEVEQRSLVTGSIVVGTVAVVVLGTLWQVARRPGGWPVARVVLGSEDSLNAALQSALALFCVGVTVAYIHRGVQQWRGEASGGASGALIGALIAAATAFAALQLAAAAI